MKNLFIDRSKQVTRLDHSDESCGHFLEKQHELRFDILLDENENISQVWRVKLSIDKTHGNPILEFKDYTNNHRYRKIIPQTTTVQDITTIALLHAWELLERKEKITSLAE